MRDERTKQVLQAIYSEMLMAIIYLCAASMVVKVTFFHYGLKDCALEWLILVGSPVYQAVRARMLQVALFQGPFSWKRTAKGTVPAALVLIAIVGCIAILQPDALTLKFVSHFVVPFLLLAFLLRAAFTKLEQQRAKKMGDEYDE